MLIVLLENVLSLKKGLFVSTHKKKKIYIVLTIFKNKSNIFFSLMPAFFFFRVRANIVNHFGCTITLLNALVFCAEM